LSLFAVVYKRGPRFNHASFITFVQPTSVLKSNATKDIKGIQRVSETSHKDILLLEVSRPKLLIFESIIDIRLFNVSEKIIRRFNGTSFVQNKKFK
ncbi:PREDICTED: uncharacterized protein LOC108378726, partial [Rhagoletis zephyria]|uniref:uncharacterized protein LOC108378726 n=1 Tax=Rhagoletis zephyria TaxID=28612 RepID=UPI0008116B9C